MPLRVCGTVQCDWPMMNGMPPPSCLLIVLVPLRGRRWVTQFVIGAVLLGLTNMSWIVGRIGVHVAVPSSWRSVAPSVLFGGNILAILFLAVAAFRLMSAADPAKRLARKLERRGDDRGAAEIYVRAGKPRAALRAFKRARAWADAARIAQSLGQLEEAAGLFRRAGGDHLNEAARIYRRLGNDGAVRQCYQELAQSHIAAERFAQAAVAWFRAGEPMRAARAAELGLDQGSLRPGVEEYRIAVQAAEAARNHTLLARLAEQVPDFERAAAAWAAAGAFDRAAQALIRIGRLAKAAEYLDRAGDTKRAAALLYRLIKERIARHEPLDSPAPDGLASSEGQTLESFAEGVLGKLREAGLYDEYLDLLQELNRVDEAVAWLAANGRRAEAADVAYQSQRWDLAVPLLEELERWGEASDVYELVGDLQNAARCAEAEGEDERALALYRRSGDRAAAARCMVRLGDVQDALSELVAIGRYDEAWELLRVQPGRVPDIPGVIVELAESLHGRGRLLDAIACLQRAVIGVALTPERIPPTLALAHYLVEVGDLQAAMGQIHRILDLDYSHQPAQELGKKVQRLLAVRSPAETRAFEATRPPSLVAPHSEHERYEIVTELGRGGMGVVFKAIDRKLERVVAVKVLRTTSRAEAERLEREAKAAATLNHPSIVTVYDFEEGLGSYLIAMEYVDGQPLDKVLKTDPLRIRANLATILPALAEAVGYAHDQQVIHRDLKPGNILLTAGDTVKIFDFGIAARLDKNDPQAAKICGTPFYMAPEQIRGGVPSPSSDIYSLGATFYHLVTGHPPFTRGNVLEAHLKEQPTDPAADAPWMPPGLSGIILRCLEKNPARRYADAHELYRDLADLLGSGRLRPVGEHG